MTDAAHRRRRQTIEVVQPIGRRPPRLRAYQTERVGPAPQASSVTVSSIMRSNRSTGTKPELALSRALHKKIGSRGLPGSPEFVYPRFRLAVFVHGDFWHRCPICKLSLPKTHAAFWRRKFKRNVERDRLVTKELQELGWNVIVIWEHEIKASPRECAQRIRAAIARATRARGNDLGGDVHGTAPLHYEVERR